MNSWMGRGRHADTDTTTFSEGLVGCPGPMTEFDTAFRCSVLERPRIGYFAAASRADIHDRITASFHDCHVHSSTAQ